jgi:hypothetical protein
MRNQNTRLYYAGAGGTIYYRDLANFARGPNGQADASGQVAFYGFPTLDPSPAFPCEAECEGWAREPARLWLPDNQPHCLAPDSLC